MTSRTPQALSISRADALGAPVVHWPEPSGLENWWNQVVGGGGPLARASSPHQEAAPCPR